MRIFHLSTQSEWDAATRAGSYRRSTRGLSLEEVGFIHLSDADQLPRVAEQFYRDETEPLLVLELESEELLAAGAELRWEDGGAGEEFPHLYGPIDPARVLTVWPAGFAADGRFAWPPDDRELLARAFLEAGADYERYRPGFPADVVDLIVSGKVDAILDLGAGTGKLTRLLLDRARQVVAVDPSERMLEQLRRISPGVDARIGTAERIPLDDRSADVVTVAQAFHWFDRDRAAAEIRRVLRPGGTLALLWNVTDVTCSWDVACGRLAHSQLGDDLPDQSGDPDIAPLPGFVGVTSAWLRWQESIARADYLRRWLTVSSLIRADDAQRRRVVSAMEAVLDADPETRGREQLLLPHATELVVYRAAEST